MELWIASKNKHKIEEIREILAPFDYQIKSLLDLSEDIDIEETGETFEENAALKATTLAKKFNTVWLSDDSGFEVDALHKKPGVFSARFMGEETPYKEKMNAILHSLEGCENRVCRYVCVLALSYPDGKTMLFRGEVEGYVSLDIIGTLGFGYDPIFFYEPFNKTFGECTELEKNSISHRGKACELLVEFLHENSL